MCCRCSQDSVFFQCWIWPGDGGSVMPKLCSRPEVRSLGAHSSSISPRLYSTSSFKCHLLTINHTLSMVLKLHCIKVHSNYQRHLTFGSDFISVTWNTKKAKYIMALPDFTLWWASNSVVLYCFLGALSIRICHRKWQHRVGQHLGHSKKERGKERVRERGSLWGHFQSQYLHMFFFFFLQITKCVDFAKQNICIIYLKCN